VCFAEMGKVAIAMGDSANQALVSHDPRTARLREEDDAMDNLHWQLLSVLLDHAIGSTVSQPPSTSRCWAASMSALPITPWRSGAGLSSWSPARCPRGGRRRLLNGGHLDGQSAHGDLVRCVARNVAPPGICQRCWTLRQGGWISGRGGCYSVQPRRQHRPPA
jgi:hypothetical protein